MYVRTSILSCSNIDGSGKNPSPKATNYPFCDERAEKNFAITQNREKENRNIESHGGLITSFVIATLL